MGLRDASASKNNNTELTWPSFSWLRFFLRFYLNYPHIIISTILSYPSIIIIMLPVERVVEDGEYPGQEVWIEVAEIVVSYVKGTPYIPVKHSDIKL